MRFANVLPALWAGPIFGTAHRLLHKDHNGPSGCGASIHTVTVVQSFLNASSTSLSLSTEPSVLASSTSKAITSSTSLSIITSATGQTSFNQVSTTPRSSVPTARPSSSSKPSAKKRGLAFTNVELVKPWTGKSIAWAYNWWTGRGELPAEFEYLPMMWCPTKLSASAWISAAKKAISEGTKHVLGFNEPDQPGQCDIPVANAVAGHKTHMNPLKGQALVGSPCITNNPAPKGIAYLTAFLDQCAGDCSIDFLCTHWYGTPGNDVWNFQRQVNRTIELGREHGISQVYVTEFGLTDATEVQKESFLKSVLPWMDENPNVGGYSYFMASDGILMDGGSLSSLGEVYADA